MISKHLVISTYNFDPRYLIDFGIPYTIYDQSDVPEFASKIQEHENVVLSENMGHSLPNIFDYISSNYEELADVIIFTKANVVPRHTTKEYFEKNIHNEYYTNLYHEESPRIQSPHSDYLFPGLFLEFNDSWYVQTKDHSLFCNYEEFFTFLFNEKVLPKYITFSPGACFIVESERIRNYPKSFWEALRLISSYQFFPAEAYMVERVLHTVFSCKLSLQPWVDNSEDYKKIIDNKLSLSKSHTCKSNFAKRIMNRIKYTFLAFGAQ